MSRNLSCIVLLVSRSVVISFCRVFCAVLASAFDCLHFACGVDISPSSAKPRLQKGKGSWEIEGADLPLVNLVIQLVNLFT